MKLILSHTSALDFIRANRWRRGKLLAADIRTLDDCASSLAEVGRIRVPAFDQSQRQLEVLVPARARARKSREHICRTLMVPPMPGMFCAIGKGASGQSGFRQYGCERSVYVVSPEMLFVQMATRLEFIDLILLGMELCGTYARCPYAGRRDHVEERPPVTTKARLAAFCEKAVGMHGRKAASAAVRWVVDGSNSPAETALVLFLCLPVRLGGYGFSLPDMNPTTQLGERASRMLGHGSLRCDLHWVNERVVVEYDSDQEHLSSQSAARDARRRNTLGYANVTVITVRKPMIAAAGVFDGVVRQLARALGRRLRPRDMQMTCARVELRLALFPWLRFGVGR